MRPLCSSRVITNGHKADYLEPYWQRVFWGANYERLQQVKAQYDPRGVFACHHCVELPGAEGGGEEAAKIDPPPPEQQELRLPVFGDLLCSL